MAFDHKIQVIREFMVANTGGGNYAIKALQQVRYSG